MDTALSNIRQMIKALLEAEGIDPDEVLANSPYHTSDASSTQSVSDISGDINGSSDERDD
jgi:hypothetical protein